jgi:hypothetical protein
MTKETKETERGAETKGRARRLRRPSNVLVNTSDEGGEPRLPAPEADDARRTAFVVVSLLPKTETRLGQLEDAHGGPADTVHVIGVEERVEDAGYDTVLAVNRPGDLTGLSMRIGEVLSEVHGDDIYLYFDDVTSLLQYTDLSTAYRFLNVLTGRVRAADGVGYFGVTPGAHDERTVNTLRNLFDDTVGEFP